MLAVIAWLSALLCVIAPSLQALQSQSATVTGVVRSATLGVIPGAVVEIPSLGVTGSTNDLGMYRLVVPAVSGNRDVTLQVRALGYQPRSMAVSLRSGTVRVDITLTERALTLDRVVVTGTAGLRERGTQPAVVGVIDASTIVQQASITNVGELLQARIPGLAVTPSSGSSGQAQRIVLRGASSISLSNEPLVFIDGVRADSRNQTNNANGGQASSRLFDIAPQDIDRIEVVKGPAAATLYGADATTGVIQIFTKRGVPGAMRFSQRLTMEYDAIDRNWNPPDNVAACGAADVASTLPGALCQGQSVGAIVRDNPLMRENVVRNGDMRSLTWSARGGGSGYGYYLALTADDEAGTLPQNGFTRRGGRLNFDFSPSSHLDVSASLGLVRSVTEMPQNGDLIGGFLTALLGSPLTVGGVNNGWSSQNQTGVGTASISQPNTVLRATPTMQLRHAPTAWFTHRVIVGADVAHSEGRLFYPKNDNGWYGAFFDRGWVGEDRVHYDVLTADYLATGKTHLARQWAADLSLGVQANEIRNDNITATGAGLVSNTANTVSAGAERSGSQTGFKQRTLGLLGQLQLAHRDRLFVQVGARYDRQSTFGDAVDGILLPKFGVSYLLSEEPFWKSMLPHVGTLRLRAAYGTTGRAPISGSALRTFAPAAYVSSAGTVTQGFTLANRGNADLKPERGAELEGGIDAALFGDRLSIELTAYDKRTRDLLLRRALPPSYGFNNDPFVNIAEVRNDGGELALQAQLLTRPRYSWEARVATSVQHNELVDLGGVPPTTGTFRITQGRPLGALYSRRIQRVDVAAGKAIVSDSAEFVSSGAPASLGNASTTLSLFRRVRLYSSLDWKTGYRTHNFNSQLRDRDLANSERRVVPGAMTTEERLRRLGPYSTASGVAVPAGEVQEPYMEDASFLRWRELSLSYTLPRKLAAALRSSDVSLTAAVRNLALWTPYDGDPEVVTYIGFGTGSQFTATDVFTMPQPRRLMLRLDLSF